jgi:hypothetical protein
MPASRSASRSPAPRRLGPGRIAALTTAIVAVAVVLAVTIGVLTSGDDDGSSASNAAPVATGPVATGPVDTAAFCRSWPELAPLIVEEALANDDGDNTGRARRMHDVLIRGGTAPAEIAEAVDFVRTAIDDAAGGDRRDYDAPERGAATTTILAWAHDRCGYTQVEVTYRDFSFEGIPAALPAGPVSFRGVQAGKEPHIMQIYRIRDGVPGTPEEVLARVSQEPIPSVALARAAQLVGAGAFTDFDGDPAYLPLDLTPGSYLVICPIPTGINRDGVAPDRAKPHFQHGMVASFTVA